MEQLWGVGLSLLGGLSYYLATRYPLAAGSVGLTAQGAWLGFSIVAHQPGLLLSVALFTVLNLVKIRTGLHQRRAERREVSYRGGQQQPT